MPFAKYEIENLANTDIPEGEIVVKKLIFPKDEYASYLFEHKFDPTFSTGEIKKVTGLINIPNVNKDYPIVFMIRGYVDKKIYKTGMGTKKASEYFAEKGFITLSPDYLGYGDSSVEAENIYESRFQTYTTTLSLIKSLKSIKQWNKKDLFFWAHSNGGQIALSILTTTKNQIPTTLWAPVTKAFPYSVLYYTDESPDGGKLIRSELAKIETTHDVNRFSFTNYLERISAPIQIHHGEADSAVPIKWSDSFVSELRSNNINVEYYKYPNADHNLRSVWDTAIKRDVDFFLKNIQN